MILLYGFALIVGGGLLGLSFLGVDDLEHQLPHGADSLGHNPIQWLSLRGLMYFLFVFGGVGVALTMTWPSAAWPIILALAVGGGAGIGAMVNAAFSYLKRTDSGDRTGDDTFIGLAGRMSLPFGESRTGKILVTRGDRTFELLARPFGDDPGDIRAWSNIVIVEIVRGVALVSPVDSSVLPSPENQ